MNGSAIIGIDLSKRAMQVCVVDRWGAVIEEGRVARPATVVIRKTDGGKIGT